MAFLTIEDAIQHMARVSVTTDGPDPLYVATVESPISVVIQDSGCIDTDVVVVTEHWRVDRKYILEVEGTVVSAVRVGDEWYCVLTLGVNDVWRDI